MSLDGDDHGTNVREVGARAYALFSSPTTTTSLPPQLTDQGMVL